MKLEGRRLSTNVEDRRGGSRKAMGGGLGLGGVIIVGLIIWLTGGDPTDALQYAGQTYDTGTSTEYQASAEEQELYEFASIILAGTEDVWTEIFKENGKTYVPPKLVIFNDRVQSGCGGATSQSGPFYCPADKCVYLDLSFFSGMKKQLGTSGDFAWAYVIAHEVGHHVQNLLGTLGQAHQKMQQSSEKVANQISVRLELQADFYAGIWGYYDNKDFGSLEDGDIEEGLNAATAIGDDLLQQQAYGRTVPDSFTHGTSAQRTRWLKKGLTTGNLSLGDSFSPKYENL